MDVHLKIFLYIEMPYKDYSNILLIPLEWVREPNYASSLTKL